MGACSSASPLASRQSCSDSSLLFFFFPHSSPTPSFMLPLPTFPGFCVFYPPTSPPIPTLRCLIPAPCLCWRGLCSNYLIFGEKDAAANPRSLCF